MTSVLFLIACSHYDEHYQDRLTGEFRNKLREAMIVFEGLINHNAFRNVSIIIFFNKTDILKEKLLNRQSNIRDEFPNYPIKYDPFALQSVQTFMVEAFASLISNLPSGDNQSQNLSHHTKTSFGCAPNMKDSLSYYTPSALRLSEGSKSSHSILSSNQFMFPRKRIMYRHFTTAVDRRNIETVFIAMQDTVLEINLRRILLS